MPSGSPHSDSDPGRVDLYDSTYGRFDEATYAKVRRETWGEDIGQNGWITAAEQDRLIERLGVSQGHRLLDIACGSGGPTLRLAERTGASVVGIDINESGIAAARRQAAARGLESVATFQAIDASGPLPFEEQAFDATVCIDAINHLPDRPEVLRAWTRLLKPGGRLLFTDPLVVTGPLSSQEIAVRSSIGFFLFVLPDTNDRALAEVGLRLLAKEDLTDAMATTASRWHEARAQRAADLARIEGETTFAGQQRFLEVAGRLAAERRLSRLLYVAEKPG